jgi:hypothetical protein
MFLLIVFEVVDLEKSMLLTYFLFILIKFYFYFILFSYIYSYLGSSLFDYYLNSFFLLIEIINMISFICRFCYKNTYVTCSYMITRSTCRGSNTRFCDFSWYLLKLGSYAMLRLLLGFLDDISYDLIFVVLFYH